MRLTSQVALSVGVEVLFFLLWEFCTVHGGLQVFIYNVSGLWYYNAVTLPYFMMNKKLHMELKRWTFGQRKCNTELTVIGPKHATYPPNANQFQRSFQPRSRFSRPS
ncbi:unnamed protein product [Angiostrongylus costaricensis]|uniref:G_PROTEIN_RECEP_F1_2 domain-containing protein n=1 Tax=Angiostrongylus costaricensis TaxID=334426 RepID=A0A0R3PJQ3_ANGCS|nr:unnamed protein product [Angiostrongylus costaricensis]